MPRPNLSGRTKSQLCFFLGVWWYSRAFCADDPPSTQLTGYEVQSPLSVQPGKRVGGPVLYRRTLCRGKKGRSQGFRAGGTCE